MSKEPTIKKIVVDVTPMLPKGENGGAKLFVIELIKALAALKPDVQFILFTRAGAHEELAYLDAPNIQRQLMVGGGLIKAYTRGVFYKLMMRVADHDIWFWHHLPMAVRSRLVKYVMSVRRVFKRNLAPNLLRNIEADLLFCPFTAPTYAEAGIPIVCTFYDIQYKTYPKFFATDDLAHRHITFIQAARNATKLAAISEYSRQSAIAKGVVAKKMVTIHLKMAQRLFDASKEDMHILAEYGLAKDGYFLYPANFWKHKNHEMLLTALNLAYARGMSRSIKLICTGSPSKRMDWLRLATERMGLGEQVIFPGYVSNEQLSALMKHARAVVFPSLYEGFGLPVVEAMANGVAVACSNVTSLPEIAGDAALLFDPRKPDAIAEKLLELTDKNNCQGLIEKGLKRAEQFSNPSEMAQAYWQLFEQAVMENNKRKQAA